MAQRQQSSLERDYYKRQRERMNRRPGESQLSHFVRLRGFKPVTYEESLRRTAQSIPQGQAKKTKTSGAMDLSALNKSLNDAISAQNWTKVNEILGRARLGRDQLQQMIREGKATMPNPNVRVSEFNDLISRGERRMSDAGGGR